jgi:phosphohistidine phosphatase
MEAAMDLVLWRHAEAENGPPDPERRLTPKGVKQARRMAAWLRKRLPEDTRVLASPTERTRETARYLDDAFEVTDGIGPGGSASALLAAVGWPKGGGTVVVVGHQPTLGEAAALLLTGEESGWSLKKGAIVWIASRDRDGRLGVQLCAALSPNLA